MENVAVLPEVFQAMLNVDVDELGTYDEFNLRPVLPCLVRMALCAPVDTSTLWKGKRKKVLQILANVEIVNGIVALLSIDFHALELDAKKEQQLRAKIGGTQSESVLISQIQQGLAREFEQSDPDRRLRLLLSELLFIMSQIREHHREFYFKSSELFESEVYLEEVSDVLCIAQAELPGLLPVEEVAEALLHVKNGSWLLCRLVANTPDCFREVCRSLVTRGEKLIDHGMGGERRTEMLQRLCDMNSSESLTVRDLCVSNCTLPGLAVALTLHTVQQNTDKTTSATSSADSASVTSATTSPDSVSDIVSFVSGLLLGNDQPVRTWFSQFIKIGQKSFKPRKSPEKYRKLRLDLKSMVFALRDQLLRELLTVLRGDNSQLSEDQVVQASVFIRLYCALKTIATLKFSDEENEALLRLVTSRPPATAGGARYICLALAMFIACPTLLGTTEDEKLAVDWIRWLMAEEKNFECCGVKSSSYGEMLFLIAIHFHSNQTHAISDLVCSTLGMKSGVKANTLQRVRHIITQEIFTEQVITSHAVTVPVTENLNANNSGFLPVHCIYQLLKNRTFSKYKVPIKAWIYRQICTAASPLHPLLQPLIEVYVTSIIIPTTKSDYTNEPITEQEILNVFQNSIFGQSAEAMDTGDITLPSTTSQLLLIFYVLSYEDCRLSNMKSIAMTNRRHKIYSDGLLNQLPISYLLQVCQRDPHSAGLFAALLRLLVSHTPHLCLVEDWLDSSMMQMTSDIVTTATSHCKQTTPQSLHRAFQTMTSEPSEILQELEQLLKMPPAELLPFAETLVKNLLGLLGDEIPRQVQTLAKDLWFNLHTVMPRSLRLMTVNALHLQQKGSVKAIPLTENDVTVDPLAVLRCERAVFRCPALLEILLRILAAYLQACRVYLSTHIQANPILEKSGHVTSDMEREDLKHALISAQESAAVQILLECCLQDKEEQMENEGELSNLREVQGLICSHLHQMFILDPNLVKLVHFQGYPRELLPLTVGGIPSMHICLDFIPELIRQPQMEKQTFAVELVAELCGQYALPKSLNMAKLTVNVMFTVLEVLHQDDRVKFFLQTVPCLANICQAFPPMSDDVTLLLTQLGRICLSQLSATNNSTQTEYVLEASGEPGKRRGLEDHVETHTATNLYETLYNTVQQTFANLTQLAIVTRQVY